MLSSGAKKAGSIGLAGYELQSFAQDELRQYPQKSLYQIQAEYDQKDNAAPSGSLKESYFRGIRDQARSFMGYNP